MVVFYNSLSRTLWLYAMGHLMWLGTELTRGPQPGPGVDVVRGPLSGTLSLTPWMPPTPRRVKLNTDGSFLDGVGRTGMILWDRSNGATVEKMGWDGQMHELRRSRRTLTSPVCRRRHENRKMGGPAAPHLQREVGLEEKGYIGTEKLSPHGPAHLQNVRFVFFGKLFKYFSFSLSSLVHFSYFFLAQFFIYNFYPLFKRYCP